MLSKQSIITYLTPIGGLEAGEASMRFRLTYEGSLRPTQGEPRDNQLNPLAAHKHGIRKHFHRQLKQLWETNKFLKECRVNPQHHALRPIHDERSYWGSGEDKMVSLKDAVALNYEEFGYRFVPLVRDQYHLTASLNILFLRRDIPGSVLNAGDLDNRIKSLIDALRRPRNATELVGSEKPDDSENPFFCLLEDDNQVSGLTVETDTLLDVDGENDRDHSKVKLIISVDVRPWYVTLFNASFG